MTSPEIERALRRRTKRRARARGRILELGLARSVGLTVEAMVGRGLCGGIDAAARPDLDGSSARACTRATFLDFERSCGDGAPLGASVDARGLRRRGSSCGGFAGQGLRHRRSPPLLALFVAVFAQQPRMEDRFREEPSPGSLRQGTDGGLAEGHRSGRVRDLLAVLAPQAGPREIRQPIRAADEDQKEVEGDQQAKQPQEPRRNRPKQP